MIELKFHIISILRKYKNFRTLFNQYLRIRYNKSLLLDGIRKFKENKPLNGNVEDFKRCVKEGSCSYEEYMFQFELWNKSQSERREFMSQVALRLLYNVLLEPKYENIFWNKVMFLKIFHSYIHRDWSDTSDLTFGEFRDFVKGRKVIAKPKTSACGEGIFLISGEETDESDIQKIYDRIKGQYVVEECVENEASVKEFHPSSLNTVRIVTVLTPSGVEVLGSFIRFGTGGNVVDNGGHDGILAMVDTNLGEVMTDAFDKNGNRYAHHPNSHKPIKSFIIPEFQQMVKICKEAAQVVPQVRIIGWDIVLRKDGLIDIIEGNHRPDAYGLQMPIKKGYRTRLLNMLKEQE